jgi:hypothetical protein
MRKLHFFNNYPRMSGLPNIRVRVHVSESIAQSGVASRVLSNTELAQETLLVVLFKPVSERGKSCTSCFAILSDPRIRKSDHDVPTGLGSQVAEVPLESLSGNQKILLVNLRCVSKINVKLYEPVN